MSKINWEEVSMGIIVAAGSAKSSAMEGLYLAKEGKYKEADAKMKDANAKMTDAAEKHFKVIQKEAQGIQLEFKVLFLHAEDQLLTTQTLVILVGEMIEMYRRFESK